MTPTEFADTIIHLPADKQNEFFETLKGQLSEEDWLATVEFISVYGMFHSPAKYNAMKQAIGDTLCEEIFGHTVEKKKQIEDPCNPVGYYQNFFV